MTIALISCGGDAEARLPAGDHLHSLGVTGDGGLLLGLHGGLYGSDDGTSWELVGLDGQDAMVIASAQQPMFVAGHEVLDRSDDGGSTFAELRPADLPGLDIHAFAQAPTDGRVIYAFVVGHGLFASADAGDTWERRAELGIIPPDTFGLAIVGSEVDLLMVVGPESGVLRSEDGGRSFIQVMEVPAWAVALDPNQPTFVWALTNDGLARSDDAGLSWQPVSALGDLEGQPLALAVGSEVLWVATEDPRALYSSTDDGVTWELVARS
ncbi:MAG: WD40/YVTN/BNR-like repeat-containing protein [Acidimicrobiia bacterium]